ncbi:MAG: PAS domain S-box-containing protein [Hyphomicrobiaceae bacterium]
MFETVPSSVIGCTLPTPSFGHTESRFHRKKMGNSSSPPNVEASTESASTNTETPSGEATPPPEPSQNPFIPRFEATAGWMRYLPEAMQSEPAFRLLEGVMSMPLLFYRLDEAGTFMDLVGDTQQRLGIPPEQFIGKPATSLFPEIKEFAIRSISGETQCAEMSGTHEGAAWAALTFATPLDGGQGLIGVALDTTEWKRAEIELEASERRYRNLSESAPVGIIHVSVNGELLYVNPAMRALVGLESAPLDSPAWDKIVYPEDYQRVMDEWEATTVSGNANQFVYRIVTPDGETRWVMSKLVPDRESEGDVKSFIGIVIDISDRVRTEERLGTAVAERTAELSHANSELARANTELHSFTGTVSHDLRAPLRSVSAFLHIAKDEQGDTMSSDLSDQLNRAMGSVRRMEQLIDGLLGLAKTDRGDLVRADIDLSSLATEVLAGLRDAAPDRNIEIVVHPNLKTSGDVAFLATLLENLFSNAWKFTSRIANARIEFGSCHRSEGEAFFVRDNGAGFDPSTGDVFAPFFRMHDRRDFDGSGIGLASAQRIVELHDGQISVESRSGAGATFYFTLG